MVPEKITKCPQKDLPALAAANARSPDDSESGLMPATDRPTELSISSKLLRGHAIDDTSTRSYMKAV